MRLSELEPQFIRVGPTEHHSVDTLAEAHGIRFLCPACVTKDGHSLQVWFKDRGVPDGKLPAPRWSVSGAGYDDLTLEPSIAIGTGCMWHGHVTRGSITTA